MTSTPRLTAADVARAAGVSRATVSYVLNGSTTQRISEATRQHVRAVAEDLGYLPNAAAVNLRRGGNRLVLFAVGSWPIGPLVADLMATTVTRLEERGYHALIQVRAGVDAERLLATYGQVHPVGVIAPAAVLTPQVVRVLRAGGAAGILGFGERPVPGVHTVTFSQVDIGARIGAHLVERGHRHLVYVATPGPLSAPVADYRTEGLRDVVGPVGGTVRPVWAEQSVTAAEEALRAALRDDPRPTAVVCQSDDLAVVVYAALAELGLRVPTDLAVVGSDDSPIARLLSPQLTSVAIGEVPALRTLGDRLDDVVSGRQVPWEIPSEPVELVARGSTLG
ncbi:LacI family transcriptional regulator [Pseudonocardia sp. RS11V-5]|uniref:LacI family DNA-binding transcriptional regulator n=1 Tax=Pseudonocardia terrae TaxID=2905831 RepID=UPI001E3701B0|nr:LacI family DNA-binding transcriptional regulator [Pseudonocardia terrae]MCE3555908.1 LacI family transcriptional regulator [Pseudonocardia terrae]